MSLTARVPLIRTLSSRYAWAKSQSFSPLERVKFAAGIWRDTVKGPNQIGALRNWFGFGAVAKTGYVWGGGLPAAEKAERKVISLLLNPNTRTGTKLTLLADIISREIKFQHVPFTELRSALEQLDQETSDPALKEKIGEALKKLPPPLKLKGPVDANGKAPSSQDRPDVIQLSVLLSGGESGVLEGRAIGEPDVGGVSASSGRKENEDGILLRSENDHVLMVVADGMGGHLGGKIASALAIKGIDEAFALKDEGQPLSLIDAFASAHQKILEFKASDPKYHKAGTTAVAALIDGNDAVISNVGDSRAFLYRNGKLHLLTVDDAFISQVYEADAKKSIQPPFSPEHTADYFNYFYGNDGNRKSGNITNLSKSLGNEEQLPSVSDPIKKLVSTRITLEKGDMLLLLSDGGYKYFSNFDDFHATVAANAEKEPAAFARAMESAAKERMKSSGDNVTVAVYKHRPAEPITTQMLEPLSESDLKEALGEEATGIWQRTATAIKEADAGIQEMMKTSLFASTEASAVRKAADTDEIARLNEEIASHKKALETLLQTNEEIRRSVGEFRTKAVELHRKLKAELEQSRPDPALSSKLGLLLSGTPEQKREILQSLQIGTLEISPENEPGAIEVISRAWRNDPSLEEHARPAIDFLNIKPDEEGEK